MRHTTREDARTVKTKAAILNTLKAMILELDYQQITITQLTKRAGLHRKTFYLHYESVEQLFKALEDEIVEGLDTLCIRRAQKRPEPDFNMIFDGFTALIDSDRALHQRIFSVESYRFMFERVKTRACDSFASYFKDAFIAPPEEVDAVITFVTDGMFSVRRKWYIEGVDPSEKYRAYGLLEISRNAFERLTESRA